MLVTYYYEHPLGISLLQQASRNGCAQSRHYIQCLQSPFTHGNSKLEQLLGSMTESNLRIPFRHLILMFRNNKFSPTENGFQYRAVETTRQLQFELEIEAEEDSIPTLSPLAHKHYFLWDQYKRMQVEQWNPSQGSWGGTCNSLAGNWFFHSNRLPLPLEWSLWTLLLQ